MRLIIQIFILIGLCASCKQYKKEQKTFEYNFGLENKLIIDSNLVIADTGVFIHESVVSKEIDTNYFANKDYWFSPCFLDNDTLKIIRSSGITNYRFYIKDTSFRVNIKENTAWLESVYKDTLKNKAVLKQRLLINKINFKINDTIKLKYYTEIRYIFKTRNDALIKDSICVEYIIKQKKEELMYWFNEIDYTYNNDNLNLFHGLKSNFFKQSVVIDSTLNIPESIDVINNRVGQTFTFPLHFDDLYLCFYNNGIVYLNLSNHFYNYTSDNFYLFIKGNEVRYTFDSTDFHQGNSCVHFAHEFTLFKSKIILNKNNFNIGDTLKVRAYFITKTKKSHQFMCYLDTCIGQFIVNKYDKNIQKELSKFPK